MVKEMEDFLDRQHTDRQYTGGWQTVDCFADSKTILVAATRSHSAETKAGKLIDLGFQLEAQAVVLLVGVVPEANKKIRVQVRVLPTGDRETLPARLTIALLSSKEQVLQTVTSRERDNFIQLKSFKGKSGTRFRLQLTLNDVRVAEDFEL